VPPVLGHGSKINVLAYKTGYLMFYYETNLKMHRQELEFVNPNSTGRGQS
jgi:hypothetical protein